jgi:RNA polymerase sigma-70 factor, ECF subfamily
VSIASDAVRAPRDIVAPPSLGRCMPLDRSLVETLYRQYGFQVARRCRRILGDSDEATDAAQEVFVRLLTKGADFRGAAEWITWLYRVATNVCLNRLRDQKTRAALLLRNADEIAPSSPSPPDAAGTADRRFLVQLLEELDETTQEIVLYHLVDEMSQGEIAELVGLSRVTVNKRLMRFRARAEERARSRRVG